MPYHQKSAPGTLQERPPPLRKMQGNGRGKDMPAGYLPSHSSTGLPKMTVPSASPAPGLHSAIIVANSIMSLEFKARFKVTLPSAPVMPDAGDIEAGTFTPSPVPSFILKYTFTPLIAGHTVAITLAL